MPACVRSCRFGGGGGPVDADAAGVSILFLIILLSQEMLKDSSFFADSIGSACLRPHGSVRGRDIISHAKGI